MSIVPANKKTASGVDNTNRRVWDREEFRKKAEEKDRAEEAAGGEESVLDAKKRRRMERDPLHQGLIVARSNLKGRDYQVDLASKLNRTQVVGLNANLSQQPGYYCGVCDCVLKDSQSYLDHINGKYHNRALGMNMRVERSTVHQVKARLEMHKQKRGGAGDGEGGEYVPDGFGAPKVSRGGDGETKPSRAAEEEDELGDDDDNDVDDDEAADRGGKREKRAAGGGAEEEPPQDDADQEMMALMGFGGFGGGKKK